MFKLIKEGNAPTHDYIDEIWGHYAKWSKPDRERQISYDITCMWNLKKMIQMNFLQNRNRPTNIEKQMYGY